MSGTLSPSEVQSLFAGLDLSAGQPAGSGTGLTAQEPQADADQFTLPLSLVASELATLEAWQTAIAERFSETATAPLRGRIAPQAAGFQLLRLRDFVTAHSDWHCFQVAPARGGDPVWIALDELLAATHLNCLLGANGPNATSTSGRRPWGALELQLTGRLVNALCESMFAQRSSSQAETWMIKPIQSAAEWIAGLPVYLSCEVVQLQFEVACSGLIGRLSIGIPRRACLDLFRPKSGEGAASNAQFLTVRATLPPISLTTSEFNQLQVGDVLLTTRNSPAACLVLVDGQLRFEATIGAHQGHKAIRLTAVIE